MRHVLSGIYLSVLQEITCCGDRKVPKFSYARKHCCNLPKIQGKRPNLCVFLRKEANGIVNSEDRDQTV